MMQAKLGLGLAALGRPGYINLGHGEDLSATHYTVGAMKAHAHTVFDAAWELGIRYFDAARSYGRAEEFLGTWLAAKEINPNQVSICSKWGYTYTAAWRVQAPEGVQHEIKRHEFEVLQSQFQQTMKQLGDHLGCYQIHSATIESGVLENKEVLECLHGLKNSGIQIGLTVSGTGQSETINKALQIRFDDQLLFSSVQATWNLLEKSATSALQKAHDSGLKVIVKECLANGRLTSRNQSPEFSTKKAKLESAATAQNTTIDALAIAAALNQPWSSVVLCGASNAQQLRSNLRSTDVEWSQELGAELDFVEQTSEQYWDERANLAWN